MSKLSVKAQKLYDFISANGGGALDEWLIRDKTSLSHGSFCAARKELVADGLLKLGKDGRKTTYHLTSQNTGVVTPPPPVAAVLPVKSKKSKPVGFGKASRKETACLELNSGMMPHVTGEFASLDDWMDALAAEFGECVDVSPSLTADGEYIVFSASYMMEDIYTVTETDDGIVVE